MNLIPFRILNIITIACIFCNINFLSGEINIIGVIEVTGVPVSVFRTNQIPVVILVSEYLFIIFSSPGIVMSFMLNNKCIVLNTDID